jgi:hypothetical protein
MVLVWQAYCNKNATFLVVWCHRGQLEAEDATTSWLCRQSGQWFMNGRQHLTVTHTHLIIAAAGVGPCSLIVMRVKALSQRWEVNVPPPALHKGNGLANLHSKPNQAEQKVRGWTKPTWQSPTPALQASASLQTQAS